MEESGQNFVTEIFFWGLNRDSQCSANEHEEYIRMPIRMTLCMVVRSVACGQSHTILSTNEGLLYGLGSNKQGQLGLGMAEITNVSQPTLIPRLQNIDSVVSGFDHCLALTDDGIVYGWGQTYHGQLGLDIDEPAFEPIMIQAHLKFQTILAGGSFSALVGENNMFHVIGKNILNVQGIEKLYFFPVELGDVYINFACTGHDCILISSTTNLYLAQSELKQLPLNNIQQLYSGYQPLILGEDDILYEYISDVGELTPVYLPSDMKVVDCTRGIRNTIVVDEKYNVYEAYPESCHAISDLKGHEVRVVVAGLDHFVALGQISKRRMMDLSVRQETDGTVSQLEGGGLSPLAADSHKNVTISNNSSLIQPDSMLFSFSVKKDMNQWSKKKQQQVERQNQETQTEKDDQVKLLQSQIKSLEAELITLREEHQIIDTLTKEVQQLKKQRSNQQKNLNIQMQYQQTLQEQISRLVKENDALKMKSQPNLRPEREIILEQIQMKQERLKSMISSFYSDHQKIVSSLRQNQ